jgi:hypothetical protein
MALTAIKKADRVGLEKHNCPIGVILIFKTKTD